MSAVVDGFGSIDCEGNERANNIVIVIDARLDAGTTTHPPTKSTTIRTGNTHDRNPALLLLLTADTARLTGTGYWRPSPSSNTPNNSLCSRRRMGQHTYLRSPLRSRINNRSLQKKRYIPRSPRENSRIPVLLLNPRTFRSPISLVPLVLVKRVLVLV